MAAYLQAVSMDNEGSNAAKTRREGPAMRVPSPFQRPLKQKMAQVRKEGRSD